MQQGLGGQLSRACLAWAGCQSCASPPKGGWAASALRAGLGLRLSSPLAEGLCLPVLCLLLREDEQEVPAMRGLWQAGWYLIRARRCSCICFR